MPTTIDTANLTDRINIEGLQNALRDVSTDTDLAVEIAVPFLVSVLPPILSTVDDRRKAFKDILEFIGSIYCLSITSNEGVERTKEQKQITVAHMTGLKCDFKGKLAAALYLEEI